MMCRSDGEGDEDYIEDVNGLSTEAALSWLLKCAAAERQHKGSKMRACGYYLSYDWTMILKDLPNHLIYRLLRPELRLRPKSEGGGFTSIPWRPFRLHYL